MTRRTWSLSRAGLRIELSAFHWRGVSLNVVLWDVVDYRTKGPSIILCQLQ